jgi:hypothetical protein
MYRGEWKRERNQCMDKANGERERERERKRERERERERESESVSEIENLKH